MDNQANRESLYQQVGNSTPNQVLSFYISLAWIFLVYFCFEFYLIRHGRWSMDDFWLTYHNLEFARGLPYRDFWPYKTVLGYYIFLWPLLVFKHDLMVYEYIKFWLLFINMVSLAIAAKWMSKIYARDAVLIAVGLVVFSFVFLKFSTEIRVDILAFWACLFCVLAVLEQRFWLAGICLGLGFMICQKVLWYWVATNLAMFTRRQALFVPYLRFNLSFLGLILLYFAFWGGLSSFQTVFQSVVHDAYVLNGVTWYLEHFDGHRLFFVLFPLKYEDLWWISFPISVISILLWSKPRICFELVYVGVILAFLLSIKQPFPYLYLAALPALLIFYAQTFTVIGSSLGLHLHFYGKLSIFSIALLFMLYDGMLIFRDRDNQYQRYNYHLVQRLVTNKSGYIGGIPFLLDIPQEIEALSHLTLPIISYINQPSAKLFSLMQLKSLYFSPINIDTVIQEMKKKPILLYLDNNRFQHLSPKFHQFLHSQYQHFTGSIFLYAPVIKAGEHPIKIKFSGQYQVKAKTGIYLNHQRYSPNQLIMLSKGDYFSQAKFDYRLVWLPKPDLPLDGRFQANARSQLLD